MKPKLVISSRASGGDYRAAISFAQENCFDGIDWNLDYYRIPAASNARKAFVEAALNSGMPSRFHGPCQDIELAHIDPVIAATAVSYLKMYIEFIKVFPETHLNLHIGSRSIPETELSWETAVANLKELVCYGQERGVTVCIENLKQGLTSDPEKLKILAEESGALITLDIGHAMGCLKARHNDLSLEEYIRPFASRIRNIHLYEIETVDGRHHAPENLDSIGGILRWALNNNILWWVLELTKYDEMLQTKKILETEFFSR